MNSDVACIHDSVFRIGIVCSVNGREVKIRVDRNKNSSHLFYHNIGLIKLNSQILYQRLIS